LPDEPAISSITLAELAAAPLAASDPDVRAVCQDRLQRTEVVFDPLPFDANAARAYARVYGAVAAAGRRPRGARALDLLIAAVALANGLALYTRHPRDLVALDGLLDVRAV